MCHKVTVETIKFIIDRISCACTGLTSRFLKVTGYTLQTTGSFGASRNYLSHVNIIILALNNFSEIGE